MKKLFLLPLLLISALSFGQVKLGGFITTLGLADTYPTHLDSLQAGGYTTTYNRTTRNAIPAARRKVGMVVRYSSNTDSVFVLTGGILNANWSFLSSIPSGAAGGDLTGTYPNPTVNTINGITKTYYDPTSSIQTQLNGKSPISGNDNYIKNGTSPQTADFNIGGTGTAGILNATTQFNLGASKFLYKTNANIFLGQSAGNLTSTDTEQNMGFGVNSGQSITTGGLNTFFGYHAGQSNTTGRENVFIGHRAGEAFTGNTGSVLQNGLNVFIGSFAGYVADGQTIDMVLVGQKAGTSMLTGSASVIVGAHAGANVVSSTNNVIIGRANMDTGSGGGDITAIANVSVGDAISQGAGAKSSNTMIGHYVARTQGAATGNTYVGSNVAEYNVNGNNNTLIGLASGANSTGSENTFVGASSGGNTTSGTRNTYFGFESALGNLTGLDNVVMGWKSGRAFTGSSSIILGSNAGGTAGGNNVFIGKDVATSTSGGGNNVAIGFSAYRASTADVNNVVIGASAGNALTSSSNAFLGYRAGVTITGGSGQNTFLGNQAGELMTSTGAYNTFVGSFAGSLNTTGSGNVFIGSASGNNTPTVSNTFVAGGDNTVYSINDIYFGKGPTSALATPWTLHGTEGVGADKIGGEAILAGGRGTGLAAPGTIRLKTSSIGPTGSTLQTLSDRVVISGTDITASLPTTVTSKLVANGSINSLSGSSATGFTRGSYSNHTLNPYTNGDLLIESDIAPTFATGSTAIANGTSSTTITNAGTGFSASGIQRVALTGGSGTGVIADITITAGSITLVNIIGGGQGYAVSNTLSVPTTNFGGSPIGGSGAVITVGTLGVTGIVNIGQRLTSTGVAQRLAYDATHYVDLSVASATTPYGLTLPSSAPAANQVLAQNSGNTALTWVTPTGFANPMTTAGDLIYGGASGTPTRLPLGTTGQVLSVSGGTTGWSTISAGTNMTISTGVGTVTVATQIQTLSFTASGDGVATSISIPHGLSGVSSTSKIIVQPKNSAAAGVSYCTSDATNVNIVYTIAPVTGTNNLSYDILIRP